LMLQFKVPLNPSIRLKLFGVLRQHGREHAWDNVCKYP
jgi:hypothetical protein